jgi:hypothetical protein
MALDMPSKLLPQLDSVRRVTPEEALAREEIRYTLSVYNNAGDRGQVEELSRAFTIDGVLEFPGSRLVGRKAIAEGLGGTVALNRSIADRTDAARPLVRHHLTTSRVELVSDAEAVGWTYFTVITNIGLDHCGVYADRFTRTDDRWLISLRRVKIDWRDPRSQMASAVMG